MSTRPIRFLHRGETVEVDGVDPTRSVLRWLREDAGCTGTKEGCAEGDCGACTVVLGRLDGPAGAERLLLEPVNACIRFLPTIDGLALFTVEDLAARDGTLHPVQQALVDCHGSQCGFCTPGFAMTLWAGYERHQGCGTRPSRQDLADELSGNLCRCTGYRPILDAGQRMFELPAARLDPAPVVEALRGLREDAPLADLAGPGGSRYHAPRTLEAFAALVESRPQARILAGATDIGLWVNKQFRELPELVYVGEVEELRRVQRVGSHLHIGAAASLEAAWRELVAHVPALAQVWLRFASPPVRHAGTLGGNVANGSPIGDSAPVLMALGARLELRRGQRVRGLPLAEFYVDYLTNRLEPGEFLQSVVVPLPGAATQVRAYKVSKRFDSDISALCAGLAIALDDRGTVSEARLAFGGMAATVRHARHAEAALLGRPWDEAALADAQEALAGDFTPLTDLRASAGYRLQVARNLLRRFWLETRAQDPLPPQAVSVFASMPHALPQPTGADA